ncbi:hypothetical protein B0P06_002210 [Clostridium saccharoperbutylacetonicum]|uniref:Uncharacterized protein n=1 Tax=Clostridium saccharoperbutylacetonicum N1-4(HMT) TaxID=931276 RepID=M1MY43_9CLOT|nr:hypothetical protein [Clostridium saccharoperbutylacetonicum]AGF59451.1 hypothetical protein Cspa_c57260 [Clostridium saccharoperbutylacetonicum N1-4(HMT)]NRT59756.1 hypothetical protein [Clostridium saccharoperbutylacetonicum]NSB23068.1 hypothetical protein [Clostridium saccharoperbutylacetonicum]NSB42439.1 hypothetical protein [Clostridium saccharoperbutylacetonicum]
MVTEFKNKEQLVLERSKKVKEELRYFFSEKDYDRLCRIFRDEAKGDDRLVVSNLVIKIKFKLRKIYKKLDQLYEDRKISKNTMKLNLTVGARDKYEKYIESLNEYIDNSEEIINHYGGMLVYSCIPLVDKYFSEHEIIQILGGSYTQAKRIKEYYNKKETGTESITDSFILHHVEYRWKKGRCKDLVDCPDWEMPLFNCVSSYMWKAINSSPKAREKMDNYFEDKFGELMSYTTFDSQGNVINVEKIYQNLTQNGLIRDYQGPFISELKQKNIFDNETIYKIKRIDNGVYSIIGEDKKEIARIYKKIG